MALKGAHLDGNSRREQEGSRQDPHVQRLADQHLPTVSVESMFQHDNYDIPEAKRIGIVELERRLKTVLLEYNCNTRTR